MDKDAGYMTLRIRRRPWYVWLSRAAWIFWLALWGEFAMGSWLEREYQAYSIALTIVLVSFFLGLVLYVWKRRSSKGALS